MQMKCIEDQKKINLVGKNFSSYNRCGEVQQFKDKIHASTTQVNQIDQIVMYCMSAEIDYVSILHELLKQDIQEKEDGKRVLNAFQRRCCGE